MEDEKQEEELEEGLEAEEAAVPFIIPEGRKGGSTVCAAIVNALLIMAGKETERQDGRTT